MRNYIYKYSRYHGYLFLSAYLFLIALTVFHHHNINLMEGNYKLESNSGDSDTTPFNRLIDFHHECLITQFSSTVLNISYAPKLFARENDNKGYFIIDRHNRLPYHILAKHSLLRAPPSFFF